MWGMGRNLQFIRNIFATQAPTLAGICSKFSTGAIKFSCVSSDEEMGFHKIKKSHENPFSLFKEWYNEHIDSNPKEPIFRVFCFSTSTAHGTISSRNLLLRRLDNDGFVIMTDSRSHKAKNLAENPRCAATFLWNRYISDSLFTRQIRAEGTVEKLKEADALELYENEPVFAKIRAHICHQGKAIVWDELNNMREQIINDVVQRNKPLPKPDHVVAYKITPHLFDFYEVDGKKIADRLLYTKKQFKWENARIAA